METIDNGLCGLKIFDIFWNDIFVVDSLKYWTLCQKCRGQEFPYLFVGSNIRFTVLGHISRKRKDIDPTKTCGINQTLQKAKHDKFPFCSRQRCLTTNLRSLCLKDMCLKRNNQ